MTVTKKPREEPSAPGRPEERRRGGDRIRSHSLADGTLRDPQGRTTSFLGSTIDLSLGGALVRTYEALASGSRVVLHLRLPEGAVAATGTVVHVTIDPIGCRLAGIRFDPLVAESAELLARHLDAFHAHAAHGMGNEAHVTGAIATVLPVTGRIESHGPPR